MSWFLHSFNSIMNGFSQDSVDAATEKAEEVASTLQRLLDTSAPDLSVVDHDTTQHSVNHAAVNNKDLSAPLPSPPDYWTVVENTDSFTINLASSIHADLWEEQLGEHYKEHKKDIQHGVIFKILNLIDGKATSVTVTLYKTTRRLLIQGKEASVFMRTDFAKLGQKIQSKLLTTADNSTHQDLGTNSSNLLEPLTSTPTSAQPTHVNNAKVRTWRTPTVTQMPCSQLDTLALDLSIQRVTDSDSESEEATCPSPSSSTPIRQTASSQTRQEQGAVVPSTVKKVHSGTQTQRSKFQDKLTQTARSSEDKNMLQKENSQLVKELESTKNLLKKAEIALKSTREQLSVETAVNLTFQEDFTKVSDQIARLQREKVALIVEMASLRLACENIVVSPTATPAAQCSPSSDMNRELADLRATVEILAETVTKGDPSWVDTVKQNVPKKTSAKSVTPTRTHNSQSRQYPSIPVPAQSEPRKQPSEQKTYMLGASILRDINPRGLEKTTVRSIGGATNERLKQELEGTDLT